MLPLIAMLGGIVIFAAVMAGATIVLGRREVAQQGEAFKEQKTVERSHEKVYFAEGAGAFLREVQSFREEPIAVGVLGPKRRVPSEIVLVKPLFTGIRDLDQLVFRWEPMEGAVQYRVKLLAPETEEITTRDAFLPYPSSFSGPVPGRRCDWRVAGIDSEGRTAKVRVGSFWLLREQERKWLEAREKPRLSILQRAAYLYSVGLYEEAIEQLLELASSKELPKRIEGYKGLLVVWRTIYDQVVKLKRYEVRDEVLREMGGLQEKLRLLAEGGQDGSN